jgi:DNA-binding transcriptional LysR family regulator
MDRFDAIRVFTRVVERRSFTLAVEDLALPRSPVTDAVKQLEARLGVRLLQRTTRHVSPTLDGEAYHRRCLALIADLEEAEAAFRRREPLLAARHEIHTPDLEATVVQARALFGALSAREGSDENPAAVGRSAAAANSC